MYRLLNKNKMNNRGQITIFVILLLIGVLFGAILIFTGGIITTKTYEALHQNIDVGQVNMINVTDQSFGQFYSMYINSAEWWGVSLIFGMILGLFLAAYMTRGSYPKFGVILDIFIIIVIFIVSLYISSSYKTMLDALNEAGEPFLETYTPHTSMFISNLPIFVVIIGVVAMVLFHSSIPRRAEESYQSGGYLQGAY
jgi:hypothetical protein